MSKTITFEDIRPYTDEEANEILHRITKEEAFKKVLTYLFPKKDLNLIIADLQNINSVYDFQNRYSSAYIGTVIKKSTNGLFVDGLENLDKNESYLFMSNHRDIVLDSAIMNYSLLINNFETTEIAIGNNLLILPWITDLVRLNKSFIVHRDLQARQKLLGSKVLSQYIHHTLFNKKTSIWIAQRQGRTKNGIDKTHTGLLKMINMGGESDIVSNFKKLKLVPVSISYEYEPCDDLKVAELYAKSINPNYKKDPKNDLLSMRNGLENPKGKISFYFEKPLDVDIEKLSKIKKHNEQFYELTEIIDKKIVGNYKLWPNNYIANDIINNSTKFSNKYTIQEKNKFETYMHSMLKNIEGNKTELKNIFLEIYSNPVKCKIKLNTGL